MALFWSHMAVLFNSVCDKSPLGKLTAKLDVLTDATCFLTDEQKIVTSCLALFDVLRWLSRKIEIKLPSLFCIASLKCDYLAICHKLTSLFPMTNADNRGMTENVYRFSFMFCVPLIFFSGGIACLPLQTLQPALACPSEELSLERQTHHGHRLLRQSPHWSTSTDWSFQYFLMSSKIQCSSVIIKQWQPWTTQTVPV